MISYTLKRIAMAIPTLVGVSLVTFLLLRLVPGGPVQAILGVASTNPAAEGFRRFLISAQGKAIFRRFGFSTR